MKTVAVSLVLLTACVMSWAAQSKEDSIERLNSATAVLQQVLDAPDKGIPEEVFEGAKCVAVVPHLVKAAFIVGGEHGRGVATCRTSKGWSAPAFFTMTGGSWGAQIGAQSTDLVMLVMNDQGVKHLLESKFKIGADASAAAGPVGRHASVGTDWKLETEILTYSRSHGIFAGISLNGTVVEKDEDTIRAFYGHEVDYHALLSGNVPVPEEAMAFVRQVSRAKVEASNK